MIKKIGVIHALARCVNCGWEADNHHNAQAIAAIHAKKHGHKVVGEVGIGFEYDGS